MRLRYWRARLRLAKMTHRLAVWLHPSLEHPMTNAALASPEPES